jgi:peptidoglycan hydrolase CwlO-like protein
MAKRPTIASLQAEISELRALRDEQKAEIFELRADLAVALGELAALKATASAPKAAASAKAAAPAQYPRVREYSDRNNRWWRKTSYSANRHSTVEITGPGGEKVAPAASAIAASKAACTGADAGLMDGVRC